MSSWLRFGLPTHREPLSKFIGSGCCGAESATGILEDFGILVQADIRPRYQKGHDLN